MAMEENGNNIEMQVEAVNEFIVLGIKADMFSESRKAMLHNMEKAEIAFRANGRIFWLPSSSIEQAFRRVREASRARALARVRRLELVFINAAQKHRGF